MAVDRELSPEQAKAIGRLQLIGVISNLAVATTIAVLSRTSVIDSWKLVTIGLATWIALIIVLTFLVSRVEQIPLKTLIRRSNSVMVADLRSSPARLRGRLQDALRRVRSR